MERFSFFLVKIGKVFIEYINWRIQAGRILVFIELFHPFAAR